MSLYFILSDFEVLGPRASACWSRASFRGSCERRGGACRDGIVSLWAHDFDRALDYSRQAIEVSGKINAQPVLGDTSPRA